MTGWGGRTGMGGAGGSGGYADAGGATKDAANAPDDTPRDTPEDAPEAARKDVAPTDTTPLDGTVAPDTAAQTCTASGAAPKAGDSTVTLEHGGRSRKYILHAPSALTAGTPLAVVIDLHGEPKLCNRRATQPTGMDRRPKRGRNSDRRH